MIPKANARITNRVKEFRAAADLTQEELGRKVGVTRVTINCLENGVYLPSIELAFRLSRYFKRPIEEIFAMEDS
jgi:putative transcriptional regulator